MLPLHAHDRGRRGGPLVAVLSILIAALTLFACDRGDEAEPVAERGPYPFGSEPERTEPVPPDPVSADNEMVGEEAYGEDPYGVEDPMADDTMGENIDDPMADDSMGDPIDDPMMDDSMGDPIDDPMMGQLGEPDTESSDNPDEPGSINEDDLVQNDPLVDDSQAVEPITGDEPSTGTDVTALGEDDSEVIGQDDEEIVAEDDSEVIGAEDDQPVDAERPPTIAEAQQATGRTVTGSTMQPSTELGLCGEGAVPAQFDEALVLDFAHLDNKLQDDVETTITSPASGELIEGDTLELQLDVTGFDVAANERLVQVVIDDEPIEELMRLTNSPLRVDLSQHDLEPGAHLVRVFPVRPWGELVADGTPAGGALPFYYLEKRGELTDLNQPMLSLVSPVGDQQVRPESNRVLFSIATHNVQLGQDGHKLRMTLDGHSPVELTHTVPVIVSGLPSGEHTVKLEIIDANGALVEGDFTSVERTFDVRMTSQTAFVDEPLDAAPVEQPEQPPLDVNEAPTADEPMIDKPMNDAAAKEPY